MGCSKNMTLGGLFGIPSADIRESALIKDIGTAIFNYSKGQRFSVPGVYVGDSPDDSLAEHYAHVFNRLDERIAASHKDLGDKADVRTMVNVHSLAKKAKLFPSNAKFDTWLSKAFSNVMKAQIKADQEENAWNLVEKSNGPYFGKK